MTSKRYEIGTGIGDRLAEVQRLKIEIDRLTSELEEQKAYLMGHAVRNNLDSLQFGAMTLSKRGRTTWTYSPALIEARDRVKAREKREQADGTAKAKITEHMVISFDAKAILSANIQLTGA